VLSILQIVAPVFAVVAAGWAARRLNLIADAAIEGVMSFAVRFAVPALLFVAVYRLDLGAAFDRGLLISFYAGAVACFGLTIALARLVWRRRPGEAVAIGFCALFSNSLMLGLPIMESAYGAAALPPQLAIVSLHAPTCYLIGIVTMEFSRRDGAGLAATVRRATTAMFSNAITLGVAAGFAANLAQVPLPGWFVAAADLLAQAALPAALFGLGGALTRYGLRGDVGIAATVAGVSLLLHPLIALGLGAGVFGLDADGLRAAVVTAAMPTGLNGYLFAAMYGRAQGAAAGVVLLGTLGAVVSVTGWLWVLGVATG